MSDDRNDYKAGLDDKVHPAAMLLFGWVTSKRAGTFVFWGLAVLSLLLIVADFIIDRHPHNEAESYLGFYALYGFISFGFAVLMGWPLGRILRRSEDYYGDQDDEGGTP